MKKIACCLLAALVLTLSACAVVPEDALPTPTPSIAAAAAQTAPPSVAPATPTPAAPSMPAPTATEDNSVWENDSYYQEQVAIAEACRVQTEDAEYYLDTSIPVAIYAPGDYEFPLYRKNLKTGWADYLGTTGFAFQLCGNYIYIESDMLQEDLPNGTLTRVVNLETGVITPIKRNMNIVVPESGDFVYYTISGISSIYRADPSLEDRTEFVIHIPEEAEIERRYGNRDNYDWIIAITGVADGWIFFEYYVSEYESDSIYEGSYRIRTDGTGLEKTDAGQFY